MRITTALGDSRETTRTYEDGSVDCPYCSSAIITPKTQCENPWCDAHPSWGPEKLAAHIEKREQEEQQKQRDQATRESVARFAKERYDAHQQWEQEQIAEAKRRGTCLRCLFQPGWERAKFIHHRKACPKTR